MNLIKKAVLFCRKEGLLRTAVRIGEKSREMLLQMPNIIKESIHMNEYFRQVHDLCAGKTVYVVIPCIDWNIPLFQRPHQITTVLSSQPDSYVFFVSDEYRYDNFAGLLPVRENLTLLSWRIVHKIGGAMASAKQVIVVMSWPRHAELLEFIPYSKLIYEYIDDFSLFYYYTEDMKKRHYQLIRDADLTVCTAAALYNDAKPYAKKALLSPNAGDYDFFHNNRMISVNEELAQKTQKYSCVLGYYGCLAEWFDYDLILEVARWNPQWCFALVGYCFDGTVSKLQGTGLENILLFPAQPYQNLPAFVAGFDIQIIPFVINDITQATSPVKLFEYMASGKPILVSPLPECLQYKSVTVYRDADDFIQKVNQLLVKQKEMSYLELMDQEARANTWEARVKEILSNI